MVERALKESRFSYEHLESIMSTEEAKAFLETDPLICQI